MEEKLHLDIEDFSEEQFMESFLKEIQSEEAVFIIGIFVALALVILTIVFFGNFWGTSKVRNAVLLLGLCDSGKTLLFTRLLLGKFVRTQTSITESSATYKSKSDRGNSWTLIDVPGHESLRVQIVEKYKAVARAIVFVVDSSIFQKDVRDVAEFLYSILTDSIVAKNAPTLVVACNKQDITMAKSAKLIQQQLEKELNTLRLTRSAALSSQDGAVGGSVYLGKKGKDFEFSQLANRVEFIECSAHGSKGEDGDAEIDALEKCLARI
ncbi:signal recognition particle receptor subunit beta [Labeo rohita]|uniref:Signal recognition particle receptor subunit beta n=1 Tax=Labeo rohita TaxID=84645 RepID=A0A498M7U4_LABRO|nr:signal recognition particle receptor subunit beta [Labeo rohita]RXN13257.1 signal recognition particle receptor subunit beta [Labeo rohita]RXN14417.1 signal recognition particle receptor subunit beta [Labeo rohita]